MWYETTHILRFSNEDQNPMQHMVRNDTYFSKINKDQNAK